MSTSAADLVTVPVAVPRDPGAYRPTVHFGQRLKDRVPEHDRDALPRRLIEDGRVNVAGEYRPGNGTGTPVAFCDEIAGETWTLIAALRPDAFGREGGRKHAALTVYQGPPKQPPETAGDGPEVPA